MPTSIPRQLLNWFFGIAAIASTGGLIESTCLAESASPKTSLTFEKDIRPILRAHCLDCHGATETHEGALDLRLVRFIQKGGDSGTSLVVGKPEESLLLQRIESGEMPPGEGKVSAAEIKILKEWIAAGAPTARPEPETIGPGLPILPEERAWWAYQPLQRPEIPAFPAEARVRTPIDALLLKAMPAGLKFSPDADKRTEILRVSFTLTGLPPTAEQIQQYIADNAPDAYERMVDAMLASPHYGERWGRHWLDVAGYADSEGRTTADTVRNWSYRYRDYVIRAFNENKPFDRFIHEQLAGDELAGPIKGDLTPEQIDLFTATGFLRMAADGTGSGENTEEARNQVIADTLQIVSSSLLGMSVACAQCHDHRYDPISHTDYFAMRAVFEPALDYKKWKTPPQRLVSLYTQADREAAAKIEEEAKVLVDARAKKEQEFMDEALEKELLKHDESLRDALKTAYKTADKDKTPEQKALLDKHPSVKITRGNLYQYNQKAADELKADMEKINALRATKPKEEFIRALVEPSGSNPPTHLFHRGDYRQPKQVVTPAAPAVLCPEDAFVEFPVKAESASTSGRRLAFAQWLTSAQNPITARVLANRVWLHHFGRGLVETPAEFGKLGSTPTHSELLNWLATEFMSSGWNLKQLHRTIMLSTAYRQSSTRDPQMSAIDDSNHYYWRRNLIRLDAEIVRDRVHYAAGNLDATQFGPSVPVKVDDNGQDIIEGTAHRRSLYIQQRRSLPISMLQAFDAPVMAVNCERRSSSTVATQSLMLMNSPFAIDQSLALAKRIQESKLPALAPEVVAGLPEFQKPLGSPWHFGFGGLDENKAVRFTPYPHFESGVWQGSNQKPDPKIGWSLVHARGGHTGTGEEFATIRRWIAPISGTVKITGKLKHPSENGDGVRGRIVSSRTGQAGEWVAAKSEVSTSVNELKIQAGDIVDFITDCRADVNADSYEWIVDITMQDENGKSRTWNSMKDFHGPEATATNLTYEQLAAAWRFAYCREPSKEELEFAVQFVNEQLVEMNTEPRELPAGVNAPTQVLANICQALLTSNEFLYIE